MTVSSGPRAKSLVAGTAAATPGVSRTISTRSSGKAEGGVVTWIAALPAIVSIVWRKAVRMLSLTVPMATTLATPSTMPTTVKAVRSLCAAQ